mgnify:FL=1
MASLLTENGLIEYELGAELETPIRATFLILNEEIPELDVMIELFDDETLELKL